jgi:hypothetical protein
VDFKLHTEHLRSLSAGPKTPAARSELMSALSSKHEGIRVVAAQALCQWGDGESISAVKAAIWELSSLPHRWAAVGAMCRALAPALQLTDDIEWPLALFSTQSHHENRYFVGAALFEVFPPKALLSRLRTLANTSNGHNWNVHVEAAIHRAEYRARTEA